MKKALLVVDVQNDYFPGGKLCLWNVEPTLASIEAAIKAAVQKEIPVILIQQLSGATSPFFRNGTEGAAIHPRILKAAPDAPVVIKHYADSFHETELEALLSRLGVTSLLVCGMMTQNCVTHTAVSKSAEKYDVCILSDCCTTVSELIHTLALRAVSTRLKLVSSGEAI